ncbi:MAG: PAS domain S-box protein [Rhodospirillales bacterium]|nr:PAS domain S-box protein [Rhodospirillales bacterium]
MQRQVYGSVRKTIIRSAAAVAVGVAVLAPLVFSIASYRGEARFLSNQTELIVQNLTRFNYRFPETWIFQTERIGDVVSTSLFSSRTRVRVMDARGNLVRTVGGDPAFPVLTRTRSFEDGGQVIGWVETAVSLLPILLETVLVFALSCGLAGAVVIVLRRIPLRTLDQAIARLDDMFATLEQSESRLREAQRIAHLGSWSYDYASGRIAWSREVGSILGLPADAPMSIDVFLEAVHPEDRERAAEALNLLAKMGHNLDIGQLRVIRPDWAVRHLEISSEIEKKPDGTPVRASGVVHDVTERRNAEEKHRQLALELARMSGRSGIEEIASSLVRDMNPPLAALTARAYDARRRLASQSASMKDMDEAFDFVLRQAMVAGETIDRVRQIVGRETDRRAVDLNEIIRDAIDLVRNEGDIVVDLDLAGNLPRVTADPVQIAQVVVSLARNCVEAMVGVEGPQRALRVGTGRRNGRRVWFQVEGTAIVAGVGIASAARDRLFYPYVSTKPGELGTGLLICQHIVEAHAGEFSIGDKMGGGVVASFTLPIAEDGRPAA